MVRIEVFLFGKPAWELDGLESGTVDAQLVAEVAELATELKERLVRVAEIARKLLDNGWEGYGMLYDMEFAKQVSLADAEHELSSLGIGKDEVSLREDEEGEF